MSLRFSGAAAAIAAAALLAGCGNRAGADDDEAPAVTPKPVAFEGQVDAKFAGTWQTADGHSKLEMGKDGKLHVTSMIPGPGGLSKSEVSGAWVASGGDLLFKYSLAGQPESTVKYHATLKDDQLTLAGSRLSTIYKRS